MIGRLVLIAAAALPACGASSPGPEAARQEQKGPTMRPARDGNVAIAEELEAARKAATVAAYDLFIARHPDHPLAETARRERAQLIADRPR